MVALCYSALVKLVNIFFGVSRGTHISRCWSAIFLYRALCGPIDLIICWRLRSPYGHRILSVRLVQGKCPCRIERKLSLYPLTLLKLLHNVSQGILALTHVFNQLPLNFLLVLGHIMIKFFNTSTADADDD